MKKTSGTTPLWVNLLAAGITFVAAFVGLPLLVIAFSDGRAPRVEVSEPKPEVQATLAESPVQPVVPVPEDSQEPDEPNADVVPEEASDSAPVLLGEEKGNACPNDECAMLPEKLLQDAFERGCKRIVVRPPTRVLTKEELVEVAVLVYGRLTCRHDMTFDWPGESIARGDETLYKQDLKGTPVFFRFGSR